MIFYLNDVTGETVFLKSTRELGVTRGHRIHDGYLYYLEIENNFYKIQRVRLPEHLSR